MTFYTCLDSPSITKAVSWFDQPGQAFDRGSGPGADKPHSASGVNLYRKGGTWREMLIDHSSVSKVEAIWSWALEGAQW